MNKQRRWLWLAGPAGLLCAATLALLGRPAAGQDERADDVPSGTVAFFEKESCPSGWRAATEAAGRLIIGVTFGDTVGKFIGLPLSNEENRTHVHTFGAEVELSYKSISALDGGNNQGAAAKKYTSSGTSQPASSGLPFMQLVTCVKP